MATALAQRLELIALVQQARDVLDLFLTLDSSNSDRAWEAIVELDAPRRRSYFTRKGLLLEGCIRYYLLLSIEHWVTLIAKKTRCPSARR